MYGEQTMLTNVLKELVAGNVHSYTDLAKRLGVSEGLLAQMMEDLARRGYVAPLAMDQGGGCRGCSARSRCDQLQAGAGCPSEGLNSIKGWTLTAKGLARAQS
jgi:hypothetical protein